MKRILLILLGIVLIVACKAQTDDEGYPIGYPRLRHIDNSWSGITVDKLNLTIDRANDLTLNAGIGGGGSYTFSNGLTLTGSAVTLGGPLTSHIDISGAYDFEIGDFASVNRFNVTSSNDMLFVSESGGITLAAQGASDAIYLHWNSGDKSLSINGTEMNIIDSDDLKGLVYNGDYSTNGTADDRWIPDWGAVTAEIAASGGIGTAANGLYLNGTIFELGAALNRNTTITQNGTYNLALEGYSVADAASSRLQFHDDGRLILSSYENQSYSSSNFSNLTMWKGITTLSYTGVIASNSLIISSTGVTISTEISGAGLLGTAYYGGVATANHFVQKKYVDDEISAAVIGGGGVTVGMQDTINTMWDQMFEDTADIAELVRMKYDTIPLVPWVKGEGLTSDSVSFQVGGSMIIKWESSAGDTLVVDNFLGNVDATAKSITVLVQIDDNFNFTSPTVIMPATAITGALASSTGQYITSFTTQEIPSGSYIRMYITALSTNKPNQFLGQLNGHMKN